MAIITGIMGQNAAGAPEQKDLAVKTLKVGTVRVTSQKGIQVNAGVTVPEPGGIVQAKADGKIDEGWLPATVVRTTGVSMTSSPSTIPRANALGVIDAGWIPESMVRTTDTRLSDTRVPKTHASTHRHGGSDEIATTTVDAYALPKANAAGQLDINWMPDSTTHITVPWTLAAAIAVNDLVPTPRAYIVGKNEFVLYKNGVAVAASEYEEVGPAGEYSTLIRAKFTAAVGDTLMLYGPFALRPLLVIDPSQGVVDPRLVCTRAGATYVTGPDGKIAEVAANTVPIDWSTGKGRIACFGQRTRLNYYYKSIQGCFWTPARGQSVTLVENVASPVGSYYQCVCDPSIATDVGKLQFFDFLQDINGTGAGAEQEYVVTLSFLYENTYDKVMYNALKNEGKQYFVASQALPRTTGTPRLASLTFSVPVGEKVRTLRIFKENTNTSPWDVKIYWFQIEASPCATPLIAGPEGQQVTVPGQTATIPLSEQIFTQMSLYSESDGICPPTPEKSQQYIVGIENATSSHYEHAYRKNNNTNHNTMNFKSADGTDFFIISTEEPKTRTASAFVNNTAYFFVGGKMVGEKTIANAQIVATRVVVTSASFPLNGYLSKAIIWPIALPDVQLKALTAE